MFTILLNWKALEYWYSGKKQLAFFLYANTSSFLENKAWPKEVRANSYSYAHVMKNRLCQLQQIASSNVHWFPDNLTIDGIYRSASKIY